MKQFEMIKRQLVKIVVDNYKSEEDKQGIEQKLNLGEYKENIIGWLCKNNVFKIDTSKEIEYNGYSMSVPIKNINQYSKFLEDDVNREYEKYLYRWRLNKHNDKAVTQKFMDYYDEYRPELECNNYEYSRYTKIALEDTCNYGLFLKYLEDKDIEIGDLDEETRQYEYNCFVDEILAPEYSY